MDATGDPKALYQNARVVAIRIDPCGLSKVSQTCEPQVRLVWQVLRRSRRSNGFSSIDAGMHSFYRLQPAKMKSLLKSLWELKLEGERQLPPISTESAALTIHPAFVNPNFKTHFQSALQKIILSYCSKNNLIQLTVEESFPSFVPGAIEPDSASTWMEFSGIEKSHGTWSLIRIPGLTLTPGAARETVQKIFNESSETDGEGILTLGAKMSVLPFQSSRSSSLVDSPLPGIINLNEVLNGSSFNLKDRELIEGSFKVLRRFQNPKLTHTQNLDCAGCHLATPAESFLKRVLPRFESGVMTLKERYLNPNPALYNLSNLSVAAKSTNIFRAFGYWRNYPVTNQRVINESAETAAFLNRP